MFCTGLTPLNWVMFSEQVSTANQNHWFGAPIRLTAISFQPPTATVTAAGYQRSGAGWKLIAVKRVGAPNQWFWFAVDTCSLNITQFQGVSPVQNTDSIKVSLLATPALGCTQPMSEHWKP